MNPLVVIKVSPVRVNARWNNEVQDMPTSQKTSAEDARLRLTYDSSCRGSDGKPEQPNFGLREADASPGARTWGARRRRKRYPEENGLIKYHRVEPRVRIQEEDKKRISC
jgi:hypothetical protein